MNNRLFSRQIAKATRPDGSVDVDVLGELVVAAYDQTDSDRRRTDRSMSLMIEELDTLNRRLEKLVDDRTHALRARTGIEGAEFPVRHRDQQHVARPADVRQDRQADDL